MEVFIYVISDDNYLNNGMQAFLDVEIQSNHKHVVNYCHCSDFNIFVQSYQLNSKKEASTHVVIAKREFIILFNMMLLSEKVDDILFLSIENCTLDNLRDFLLNNMSHAEKPNSRFSTLTLREAIICHHLAHSLSLCDIGALMGLSNKSVSAIRFNIMRKMGCDNKISLHRALMVWKSVNVDGAKLYEKVYF